MRKGNQIVSFLKEIAIVVIGVLIAVSVGNYKERLDNQEYLNKTLMAIESEITSSQIDIDTVLSRHILLYEKLENGFGDNGQTLGEFISSSGGFQVATIKNISLRFFISNKAELLKFEVISKLLDIELKTTVLSDKIDRLADFVFDHINGNDQEVQIKFTYLLSDVIDSEQSLLESYSEFLEDNQMDWKGNNE